MRSWWRGKAAADPPPETDRFDRALWALERPGAPSTPAVRRLIFDVSALDPLALGAAILALTRALLAAWHPVFRASRIDPAVVMREE